MFYHHPSAQRHSGRTVPLIMIAIGLSTTACYRSIGDELLDDAGTPEQAYVVGDGDLIGRGIVIREMDNFSWNGDLVASSDTHVRMIFSRYYNGEVQYPDGVLFDQSFPFVEIPFGFEIRGDFDFAPGEQIAVEIDILNHPGNEPLVGDLINEYRVLFPPGDTNVEVFVRGLESCYASYAGGTCAYAK